MLLGRAANGLYWMNRYIERAENMARLIDTGLRLALTHTSTPAEEWASIVRSAGVTPGFEECHDEFEGPTVWDYLLRDRTNSSSVLSSMDTARANARMVRTALTRETWESINEAWMALTRILANPVDERELPKVLDAVKRETALIRGAFYGTMLRNEIFDFAQLGTFVERADNTARILDVKYYVLLPSAAWVGSSLDNHQWESILRSVSAHRSYRWEYEAEYKPANVADYLIMNARMPRSLAFCYHSIVNSLAYLEEIYGQSHSSHAQARSQLAKLKQESIRSIFEEGLHDFLTAFVRDNNALGEQVARDYRFY